MSSEPHLAGTPRNNELADYIAEKWTEYEFDSVKKIHYKVSLSYPDLDHPNKVRYKNQNTYNYQTHLVVNSK